MLKPLDDLIDTADPAWPLLQGWLAEAGETARAFTPPDDTVRRTTLLRSQVTTKSFLGAVIWESAGLALAGGWIRLLGSAAPGERRSLLAWNEACGAMIAGEPLDHMLVADDVLGGIFALNGGLFGPHGLGDVFYLAPDSFDWEGLDIGYSRFLDWCVTGEVDEFYADLSRLGIDRSHPLPGFDEAYSFHPAPWSAESRVAPVSAAIVPVAEIYGLKRELMRGSPNG